MSEPGDPGGLVVMVTYPEYLFAIIVVVAKDEKSIERNQFATVSYIMADHEMISAYSRMLIEEKEEEPVEN